MITGDTLLIRALRRDELDLLQRVMPSNGRLVDGVLTNYHASRFASQAAGVADYLIAWLGGEPAGHALVRWRGSDDEALRRNNVRDPYIEALGVRSDLQSQGIGTAIMHEAERLARDRGHNRIVLAVGIENERARALYRKLGYVESGLGEVEVTWTYVDADGNEGIGRERCTYLIKDLTG